MRETYKDLVLGEHHYRILKMNPRIGSWIAMQFASYVLPAAIQSVTSLSGNNLPNLPANLTPENRRTMTEEEFHNLQDHCLAVCRRLKVEPTGQEVYYPLIHDTGRWNFEDLETDVVTVMVLTIQSLMFNVAPFFVDGALGQIIMAVAELPTVAKTKATSTDSSSVLSWQDTGDNTKPGTERIS